MHEEIEKNTVLKQEEQVWICAVTKQNSFANLPINIESAAIGKYINETTRDIIS